MFTIRRLTKSGQMPKSSSSCVQRHTRVLAASASSMTAAVAAVPVPPTITMATTCKKTRTVRTVAGLSNYVVLSIDFFDLCSSSLSA